MSFTGTLGTTASMPGNIELGFAGALITSSISQSLSFSQSIVVAYPRTISQSIVFNESKSIVLSKTISQSLSFNQSLSTLSPHSPLINQSIPFVQNINLTFISSTAHSTFFRTITDTISFNQTASNVFQHATLFPIAQTIVFIPSLSFDVIHHSQVSQFTINQSLSFNQSFSKSSGNIISKAISQSLSFNQLITPIKGNILSRSLSNSIAFLSTVSYALPSLSSKSINQSLIFNQSTTSTKANIYFKSLNDTLSFVDSTDPILYHSVVHSVNQSLSFTQLPIAKRPIVLNPLSQSLSFSQTISTSRFSSLRVAQSLPLNQLITTAATLYLTINQSLVFPNTFDLALSYNDIVKIPVVNVHIVKKLRSVTLSANGDNIFLPPPLLNDTFATNNQIKIKKTMTNLTYCYVKTSPFIKLNYTFSLNRKQANSLGQFYINNCHTHINMTDWHNNNYLGYITIDPLSISENRFYDNQVELQFEGVKL